MAAAPRCDMPQGRRRRLAPARPDRPGLAAGGPRPALSERAREGLGAILAAIRAGLDAHDDFERGALAALAACLCAYDTREAVSFSSLRPRIVAAAHDVIRRHRHDLR